VKDTAPRTFTIDAADREIKLGVFKNPQAKPPVLPLTGGLSTDAFLFGGAGFIILSVAVAYVLRRRKAAHV
jgi:LPXTG-motif cell wall-anchored protein